MFLAIQGYGRPPGSANLLDLGSGQAFRGQKAKVPQVSQRHGSFDRKKMPGAILEHVFSTGHCNCKVLFQVSLLIQILILSVLPAGYISGSPGPITGFSPKRNKNLLV